MTNPTTGQPPRLRPLALDSHMPWWRCPRRTSETPVPQPDPATPSEPSDEVVDRIHRSLSEGLYPWW